MSFQVLQVQPQVVPTFKKRHCLPAVWMRAGTSKGLYIHRKDLPQHQKQWSPILSRVMGSYDSDPNQLNGVGGATSTTSKIAVISKSSRPGVDVDYTFVQCSVGSPKLDFSGNCGNIASGVGPFALDEGLVPVFPGQKEAKVRIFNTNTKSSIIETIPIDETGHFLEDGPYAIPGTFSQGSRVGMTFVEPAGSMTGSLLPSGRPTDIIKVLDPTTASMMSVRVSCVDAANPFIFVDSSSLPTSFDCHAAGSLVLIETIRRKGAALMGLAKSEKEAANTRGTPKIAVLSPPSNSGADIQVTAFSMGKLHGSLQLTGAVCLATAAYVQGTVASSIMRREGKERGLNRTVTIRHPGGDINVDVELEREGKVKGVTVSRTARRLFEGKVYYLM